MKKFLFFFMFVLSIASSMCTQELTFINNTKSKMSIYISFITPTPTIKKQCVNKTLYLEPSERKIINPPQPDCLPTRIDIMGVSGALNGKKAEYNALLPLSSSFTFTINQEPNDIIAFDIKKQ